MLNLFATYFLSKIYQSQQDLSHPMTKSTKWPVHPAKTQISLGICSVWSESSLSAWWNLGSLATHWVHSKDWSEWADADPSLRWAHMPFCWFCHSVAHLFVYPVSASALLNVLNSSLVTILSMSPSPRILKSSRTASKFGTSVTPLPVPLSVSGLLELMLDTCGRKRNKCVKTTFFKKEL